MVLDERSRHELHRKLEEALGPEPAATLMEMLPPVGWADVATKRDIDLIQSELHHFEEIFTLKLASCENRLRAELSTQLSGQTRTILLTTIGTTLGAIFSTVGLTWAVFAASGG